MAGCSAAIWAARLGLRADWVEAEDGIGGQLSRVLGAIPDYPGLPSRDGRELIGHLARHLRMLDLRPACGRPLEALPEDRPVLVCTGVAPRRLDVPRADTLAGVTTTGRPYLGAVCGEDVVVIGGGDGAVENAWLLREAGARSVTLVHRRPELRARRSLVERLDDSVRTVLGASVAEVLGEDQLRAVRLTTGEELPARWLVCKLGFQPASALASGRGAALDGQGYVVVDATQRTTVDGLYAAGDVCTPRAPSLATAAGQAMVAIKALAERLAR